jgi:hypothetical protein
MNLMVLIFLKINLNFFMQKIIVSRVFLEKKTLLIKTMPFGSTGKGKKKTPEPVTQNGTVPFNWNDA